ncbi:hypothetical protein LD38_00200 [Agathobacter rectalis]|uniref:ASCH domain-containing protein n=1 Tax=Agathobacter rectalis TaxID=39491 RepID=A0A2U2EKT5_9FIRM|nr:hypothetical protein LD38_00200 [Agathobacter rectalis]
MKPILFNTEMVRAILNGRKTCTRRLVRFLSGENPQWTGYIRDGLMLYNGKNEPCVRKAPYQPGDVLYIRETWTEECEKYYYRADYDSDYLDPCETLSGGYPASCRNHPGCDGCMATSTRIHWRPSIHMPKEAARIWLKVTDVKMERLQEMKPVDVIKEGAYPDCWDCLNTYEESGSQCCYGTEEQCSQCDGVMMEWEKLWNSTIKKSDLDSYGWDANPWVWVIEFERCKKPKGEK